MSLPLRLTAAVLAAALLPAAAAAQGDDVPAELAPTVPLAQVATMLAYDYCPKILGGAMDMYPSWELQQLGFSDDLLDRAEPEFDYPLFMIETSRFDGKLGIASRVENGCEVIVKGDNRLAVRAELKDKLLALKAGFKLDPVLSSENVEVYSVTQNNQTFYARIKDKTGDDPETILQISLDGCPTCRSTSNS